MKTTNFILFPNLILILWILSLQKSVGISLLWRSDDDDNVDDDNLVGGLRWNDLSVSIPKKKKFMFSSRSMRKNECRYEDYKNCDSKDDGDDEKYLLQPSCGFVKNGHICAIIGPSGAGKSTLLAALSGTTPKGSSKQVKGSVWVDTVQQETVDGEHFERISKSFVSMNEGQIALLSQHDSFFSMLTPRETLHIATFLQLDVDRLEREILISNTLDKLGLRHVQTRRIGDPTYSHSGNVASGSLSGGERRRLSVGTFMK